MQVGFGVGSTTVWVGTAGSISDLRIYRLTGSSCLYTWQYMHTGMGVASRSTRAVSGLAVGLIAVHLYSVVSNHQLPHCAVYLQYCPRCMRVFASCTPSLLLDACCLLSQTERVLRNQVLHLQQVHELNATPTPVSDHGCVCCAGRHLHSVYRCCPLVVQTERASRSQVLHLQQQVHKLNAN